MNMKTAHITVNGKPLYVTHGYLLNDKTPEGDTITRDYPSTKEAKAVAKYLRYRLPTTNVRVKGGPCPVQGD